MAIDLTQPQGKFGADAQALAGILNKIQSIQQRNRETALLGQLSQALATNQPIDQVLANFNQPQRGGILNRLLNPRAISGRPGRLEQQLFGQLLTQRMQPQFGAPQVAGQGDLFAPGTVTQARPTGQLDVLQQPRIPTSAGAARVQEAFKKGFKPGTPEFDKAVRAPKSPAEQLQFWTKVLDVAGRPTLNPDLTLNENPLPNVTAEARRQIQIATEKIRGRSKPARVSLPQGSKIVDRNLLFEGVAPVPGARIEVIDKDGNRGTVPQNQLEDALRQGFKRVKK